MKTALRIVSTLARDLPQIRVIGMGLLPSQRDIVEFVESGAAGFLLKDATIEDVLRTIRSVSRGIRILPPPLAESLFTHVVEQAVQRGKGTFPDGVRMTKREGEIILLIAEGMSNKEIAQRLNALGNTPQSHVPDKRAAFRVRAVREPPLRNICISFGKKEKICVSRGSIIFDCGYAAL